MMHGEGQWMGDKAARTAIIDRMHDSYLVLKPFALNRINNIRLSRARTVFVYASSMHAVVL